MSGLWLNRLASRLTPVWRPWSDLTALSRELNRGLEAPDSLTLSHFEGWTKARVYIFSEYMVQIARVAFSCLKFHFQRVGVEIIIVFREWDYWKNYCIPLSSNSTSIPPFHVVSIILGCGNVVRGCNNHFGDGSKEMSVHTNTHTTLRRR